MARGSGGAGIGGGRAGQAIGVGESVGTRGMGMRERGRSWAFEPREGKCEKIVTMGLQIAW
jgi:hypothetical protein